MLRTHNYRKPQVSNDPWTDDELKMAKEYVENPANGYAVSFERLSVPIKNRILRRLREQRSLYEMADTVPGGKTGVQKAG
jgi:hypothetical protein